MSLALDTLSIVRGKSFRSVRGYRVDTMEDESAIEMFVGGLVLDPNTQAPVVVLKNEEGDIHLPIWIGVAEATSIASAIKELEMARPLTHDLVMTILDEVSFRVERVVITELKDSTYFAELILASGDKALILDSRPSDAIAVALRAEAPIFVTQQVLSQAQISFADNMHSGGDSQEDGEPDAPSHSSDVSGGEGQGPADAEAASDLLEEELASRFQNFKEIDKDKWNEILEELDPDDFKYKT
ncbi:bifunctional nuclease family protein [bacterium]|nr:bifunctional nuclease family protein [bacterium]